MNFRTDNFTLRCSNKLNIWIIFAEFTMHIFQSSCFLEHTTAWFFRNEKYINKRKNFFDCVACCFFIPEICTIVYIKGNLRTGSLKLFNHWDCKFTSIFAEGKCNTWCVEHACFCINVFRDFVFLNFCNRRVFTVVNYSWFTRISTIFVVVDTNTSFWCIIKNNKVITYWWRTNTIFDKCSKLIFWKTCNNTSTASKKRNTTSDI